MKMKGFEVEGKSRGKGARLELFSKKWQNSLNEDPLDTCKLMALTETEKEIQKALDNLVQGRTTIAIAHRLSTLRKADRLVVMDRGEIVEVGPHDALMAQQGAYWRLYEAQARRAEEDAQAAGLVIDSSLSQSAHSAHPAGNA